MVDTKEVFRLSGEGLNYRQIAEVVGCSRRHVSSILRGTVIRNFRPITNCIWPGLARWMNENECSKTELLRKMGGNPWDCTLKRLSSWMQGEYDPPKREIDKILKVTGMTYEECFGGAEDGT